MRAERPRLTYAELERAPDDGRRYELYDGEAVVVPAPVPWHQLAAQAALRLLEDYAAIHGGVALISPIDIIFTEDNVLQPDVVFFIADRAHLVDVRRPIRSAPDLVVEVLSPGTTSRDRGIKKRKFEEFGVREYWILDPAERRVEIFALDENRYQLSQEGTGEQLLQSSVAVGLEFTAARLFPWRS